MLPFLGQTGKTALYISSRGSFQALVDMLIKAEREQFFSVKGGGGQTVLSNSDTISRDLAGSEPFNSFTSADLESLQHQGHHHQNLNHNSGSLGGNTTNTINNNNGTTLDDYEIQEIQHHHHQQQQDTDSSNRSTTYQDQEEAEAEAEAEAAAVHFGHIRKLLYHLARNHLQSNDWKRLARFWDFTEDQIKAIEHQYTGKTSYKDHAYRMLLIWLHGLSPAKNPLNELYDALIYINKQEVAEKMRKKAEDAQHHRGGSFGGGTGGGGGGGGRFHCRCLPAIPSGVCHYCSIL